MSAQGENLTWGSHGAEIPKITPVNKKGEPRKGSGGNNVIIESQDVIELKLQESIAQYVVFGTLIVSDRGKFRIANLLKEGYDYLKIELQSNRSEGGTYELTFEILNIVGKEVGYLVGGAYSTNTYVLAQFPAYRNLMVWNVSKGYHNKKISKIVEDIFDTFLNTQNTYYKKNQTSGKKTIEETEYKLESFCIPFWNPYTCLTYLLNYAYKSGEVAGYHCWFDMRGQFNFRSVSSIFNDGDKHELELRDIVVTEIADAQEDKQQIIKEYYPDFVHKEYYKKGLAGASSERFNWFKKKQYTLKKGYKKRPIPHGPNKIFEKPEDINNIFGFHMLTGYRGENDKGLCQAMVYNQMLTSITAQAQTKVQVNGIVGEKKMKAGDKIKIKNMVQGINENVEELNGTWFVRGVSHTWNTKGIPYRQVLALCRSGDFEH